MHAPLLVLRSARVFLVVLHNVPVGMLVTHPEHWFVVSIDDTWATIALKALVQTFYSVGGMIALAGNIHVQSDRNVYTTRMR